jgi:hypothetical protein
MRWKHADHCHSGGGDGVPRDRQPEVEGTGAADDLAVLPGGVHALRVEDAGEAVRILLRRLATEIVEDRPEGADDVLPPSGTNLDAHTFSSGA